MIQGSRLRSRQTPVALAIETIRRAEIRTEQRFAREQRREFLYRQLF